MLKSLGYLLTYQTQKVLSFTCQLSRVSSVCTYPSAMVDKYLIHEEGIALDA